MKKAKQQTPTRLFMSKGPLDPRNAGRNVLLSAKKFGTRSETQAYCLGVYEALLFLAVASDDVPPGEMNWVLDSIVAYCEPMLPNLRKRTKARRTASTKPVGAATH